VVSLIQEQFPLGDAVGVAEVRRHRQFLRRARNGEQLEAGLVREAVGLALVYFLSTIPTGLRQARVRPGLSRISRHTRFPVSPRAARRLRPLSR